MVKADEQFSVIRSALREPIDEVNALIQTGQIEVGDKVLEVDIYLGGDYKVQLLA